MAGEGDLHVNITVNDAGTPALQKFSQAAREADSSLGRIDGSALKSAASVAKFGKSAVAVEGMLFSMGGAGDSAFGQIAAGAGKASMAMRSLGIVMNAGLGPVGLIVAGIAAATAALYAFSRGSDDSAAKAEVLAKRVRESADAFERLLAIRGKVAAGIEFAGIAAGASGGDPQLAQDKALLAAKGGNLEAALADFRTKQGTGGYASKAEADAAWASIGAMQKEYLALAEIVRQQERVIAGAKERLEADKKANDEWEKLEKKATEGDIAAKKKRGEWEDQNAAAADEYVRGVQYDENQRAEKEAADKKKVTKAREKEEADAKRTSEHVLHYWQASAANMAGAWDDAFQSVIFDGAKLTDSFQRLGKQWASALISEQLGGITSQLGATATALTGMSSGRLSGDPSAIVKALTTRPGGSMQVGAGVPGAAGQAAAANGSNGDWGGETDTPAGTAANAYGGAVAAGGVSSLFGWHDASGDASTGNASVGLGTAFGIGAGVAGVISASSGKAGSMGASVGSGAMAGFTAGAAIGSIIPGIGTIIGGVIGAIGGAIAGFFGGSKSRKKKRAAERAAYYAEIARQAEVSKQAKAVMQAAAGGGLMERSAMTEIGGLLAGGLTYGEAMKFFGNEQNLFNQAKAISGSSTTTNTVSVQAPITVQATINGDMDIDKVAHQLGERISTTVAASIPRV